MTGILLALAASLSWGVADFGAGVSSRRLPIPLVILTSQAAGLVFIALVVAIFRPDLPTGAQFAWGALAGAIGVLGLSAFYRGLEIGAMGIVGPISATGVVVPLAYGLARGEQCVPDAGPDPAAACVDVLERRGDHADDRETDADQLHD